MTARRSELEKQLIRDGLTPRVDRQFSDLAPALQAAVNAYDEARCTAYGRTGEGRMSDANKAAIAPFVAAAVWAFNDIQERS